MSVFLLFISVKIAIVSDTHGNAANFKKVVAWVNKENIKVILHCGDIGSLESLKESLDGFAGEFFGVLGNMDKDFKILIAEYNKIKNVVVKEDIFETEIDKKRIAITHRPEKARELAETGKYDLVFYGHTHKPCLARRSFSGGGGGERKECLLVNPGEVAGQIFKPAFAVYDTKTDKLELKILEKI